MSSTSFDLCFQPGDPEECIELTDLLDEGSSGAVFSGIFAGRTVAVKVIPGLDNALMREEVSSEISILRKIGNHSNFVQLLGSWEKENHAWVCLELCDMGSIIDLCQICRTNLQADELRLVVSSVLSALHYLHITLEIVHRDIKGKNILLNSQGEVKLTDLGIAIHVSAAEVEPAGSPHWMAPELVVKKHTWFGNDVWGLGITVLELFEGEPPLATLLDPVQVLNEIESRPAPTLNAAVAGADLSLLASFVSCCLHKDVSTRWTVPQLLLHPWFHEPTATKSLQPLCEKVLPILTSYRHFQKTGLVLDQEEDHQVPPPFTEGEDDLVILSPPQNSKHQSLSFEESIKLLNTDRPRKKTESIRNMQNLPGKQFAQFQHRLKTMRPNLQGSKKNSLVSRITHTFFGTNKE